MFFLGAHGSPQTKPDRPKSRRVPGAPPASAPPPPAAAGPSAAPPRGATAATAAMGATLQSVEAEGAGFGDHTKGNRQVGGGFFFFPFFLFYCFPFFPGFVPCLRNPGYRTSKSRDRLRPEKRPKTSRVFGFARVFGFGQGFRGKAAQKH